MITFRVAAHRTYSVQYRDLLSGGSWINLEGVPSLPNDRIVTSRDSSLTAGQRY
jgi:hypothetical protein